MLHGSCGHGNLHDIAANRAFCKIGSSQVADVQGTQGNAAGLPRCLGLTRV